MPVRRSTSSTASTGLFGAKRVITVDYLGLPVGARAVGARRREVTAAPDLLDELLPHVPRVVSVLGASGFLGPEGPLLRNHSVIVAIKHRDRVPGEFKPIPPVACR